MEPQPLEKNYILSLLENEKMRVSINGTFPREIDKYNIYELLVKLREEICEYVIVDDYKCVFTLKDDETSSIVRAIQEDQILKTKITLKKKDRLVKLNSFWEVWQKNAKFRNEITNSLDGCEEKWKLSYKYGYKMATTFMPAYAKELYKYFGSPKIVLDPCSGWGDRILGAEVANIETYIGFDPNKALRPGYSDIMKLCGHIPVELSQNWIKFSNSYEIHSKPFEIGAIQLEDNSVDFIFTSPPFYDYEDYTDTNPKYNNWIKGFYEPLFIQCSRIIKPNCYVCIYLSDTSAGKIEDFMRERVGEITDLTMQKPIGFKGIWSNETRKIHVFKKILK